MVSSLPSSSFDGVDLGSSSTSVADPEKTLALNRALQGILEGHIEAIQDAIADNKERQVGLGFTLFLVIPFPVVCGSFGVVCG